MSLILIRHAATAGNLRHAYIGSRTDESILEESEELTAQRNWPKAERVYVSPMKRCIETAKLIYPDIVPTVVEDFRECDFGDFEGLSYAELNGRPDYQAWIDSGGELPFPGGESRIGFARRCVKAFESLEITTEGAESALVVHGGTIMAIMEKIAKPHGSYFDFQVRNLDGFIVAPDCTYERIRAHRK